eukprot:6652652-Alexandrium_andersonii.AAC.1
MKLKIRRASGHASNLNLTGSRTHIRCHVHRSLTHVEGKPGPPTKPQPSLKDSVAFASMVATS